MSHESETGGKMPYLKPVGAGTKSASQPEMEFVAAVEERAAVEGFDHHDHRPRRRRRWRRRWRRFGPAGALAVLVIVVSLTFLPAPENIRLFGYAPSVDTVVVPTETGELSASKAADQGAGSANPISSVTNPPSQDATTQGTGQEPTVGESEVTATVPLPPGTPPVPDVKPAQVELDV